MFQVGALEAVAKAVFLLLTPARYAMIRVSALEAVAKAVLPLLTPARCAIAYGARKGTRTRAVVIYRRLLEVIASAKHRFATPEPPRSRRRRTGITRCRTGASARCSTCCAVLLLLSMGTSMLVSPSINGTIRPRSGLLSSGLIVGDGGKRSVANCLI